MQKKSKISTAGKNPKEFETVKALKEIKQVFDKHKLTFWLDFGTLLGAVRDKKILPWEKDLDLLLIKKKEELDNVIAACEELSKRKFEVRYFWERGMIYFHRNNCLIISLHFFTVKGDKAVLVTSKAKTLMAKTLIFFWWILTASKYKGKREKLITNTLSILLSQDNANKIKNPSLTLKSSIKSVTKLAYLVPFKGELRNYALIKSRKNCRIDKWELLSRDFEKLSKIKFYGIDFNAPNNIKEHLIYLYGNDWKIPRKGCEGIDSEYLKGWTK